MSTQPTADAALPDSLRPYLQEYAPEAIDLERDETLVILRALEHGDRDAVRWLVAY